MADKNSVSELPARDWAWTEILDHLSAEGNVQIKRMSIPDHRKQTVRRVLRNLEDKGWLYRESPQKETYYPSDAGIHVFSGIVHNADSP
ncbi:hypothetical protein [Natronobeatus ordinarius]|uniref:hypothetical protein n=1 Tax=Natronobeatus ordinarius TaxID=2963433 RepID=UPI0020CD87E5|nr:hypothetical protein [Natronobeatus ordinarius]